MAHCLSFKAVSDHDARVLILGTLPGVESLRRGQYYAKKENSFWRIMGDLIGAKPDMPYEERLLTLRRYHLALWDVCASAYRIGSLDQSIQLTTLVPNNFKAFFRKHKNIQLICFNGKPAAKLFHTKVLSGLPAEIQNIRREALPSTSPAHARMRFDEKLLRWRKVLQPELDK